jgi:hypothetical protein
MNYDVIWSSDAEQELAALWLDPAIRSLVSTQSQRLDERLAANAPDEGESRPGDHRIASETPLGILFHVEIAERRATVVHVWAFEA